MVIQTFSISTMSLSSVSVIRAPVQPVPQPSIPAALPWQKRAPSRPHTSLLQTTARFQL
jgi:hypothetical protein